MLYIEIGYLASTFLNGESKAGKSAFAPMMRRAISQIFWGPQITKISSYVTCITKNSMQNQQHCQAALAIQWACVSCSIRERATTLFRIGSVSKLLTWTAVMQLAEDGKVNLHSDVNTYLKTFQIPATYPQPITLSNMPSMSARIVAFPTLLPADMLSPTTCLPGAVLDLLSAFAHFPSLICQWHHTMSSFLAGSLPKRQRRRHRHARRLVEYANGNQEPQFVVRARYLMVALGGLHRHDAQEDAVTSPRPQVFERFWRGLTYEFVGAALSAAPTNS